MVESIGVNQHGQKLYPNPDWLQHDLKSASAEVASLYYQSSIAPAVQPSIISTAVASQVKVDSTQTQKSWFGKSKDWLWNLFGLNKKQPAVSSVNDSEEDYTINNGPPRLEPPKQISRLNSELTHRMKDSAEFEEEMRRSIGNITDGWLFMLLVNSNLYQKNLKEEHSISSHLHVLGKQEKNKLLQETHYKLLNEIKRHIGTAKTLHWTNIGLSVGMIGAIAVAFAVGGPVAVVAGSTAVGLLGLTRGGTTLAQGIMQRDADVETGDLHMVKQELKINSKKINDEIEYMQTYTEDIGELLKSIRRIIDDYNTALRGYFGRNS
jgi:hypothetical protein